MLIEGLPDGVLYTRHGPCTAVYWDEDYIGAVIGPDQNGKWQVLASLVPPYIGDYHAEATAIHVLCRAWQERDGLKRVWWSGAVPA